MTYDAMPATSPDISLYNAFVTAEAALDPSLPSGVTWNAVVSTPTINANVNAQVTGFPVFNTQGNTLASPTMGLYAGLGLLTDVISDQYGNTAPLTGNFGPNVWTGSNAFGYTVFQASPVGGDPNGFATQGYGTEFVANQWINFTESGPLSTAYHIYALSSPITVVPEPSSIVLVVAAALLCGIRRLSGWKVIAAMLVLMSFAGGSHAATLTYNLGPFIATNGDVIDGSVTIQNGTTITAFNWEVLRGSNWYAGAASPFYGWFQSDFLTQGNELLLAPNASSYFHIYTTVAGSTSPPTSDFVISPYANGIGDTKYGLQISGGYNLYFGGPTEIWYADTSGTSPTQPYVIGTLAAPEPSSVALAVIGLAFLLACGLRRRRCVL